jgi:hypothetical protein
METPNPPDPSTSSTSSNPPNLPNLPTNVARLPIPGNAEWFLWFAVEIVFAIIWAASDAVDAGAFVAATTAITFAYLISRGIAKASRVLEQ